MKNYNDIIDKLNELELQNRELIDSIIIDDQLLIEYLENISFEIIKTVQWMEHCKKCDTLKTDNNSKNWGFI